MPRDVALGLSELERQFASQNEEEPADSDSAQERPRIAQLSPPGNPITIEQWRTIIAENFPALARAAEVCLSVVVQLLLNDVFNPFALALVDVPSSGKTIILNFFDGLAALTYTTDSASAASWVSNASNVARADLPKIDLLPRIRYKTMIVRELGSIFGAKDDDLIKTFGLWTRLMDGEGLQTDSGSHGSRGYKGDYLFMFLGGSTPIAPRIFKVMGNFGSRLFFLLLHAPEIDDDELVAQNLGTNRKTMELECKKATTDFLQQLWAENQNGIVWDKREESRDCLHIIARCARLLASLRGTINIWHDEASDTLSHTVPVIEKPNRINCLFYNLARGHAIIYGRRKLALEDLWPVLDVTFDSASTIRAKLFRGLIEAGGTMTTSEVMELLRCSRPTARKEMEALSVLGIVDKTTAEQLLPGHPEDQITLQERFDWFLSDECERVFQALIPKKQQFAPKNEGNSSKGCDPFFNSNDVETKSPESHETDEPVDTELDTQTSYTDVIKKSFAPCGTVQAISVDSVDSGSDPESSTETPQGPAPVPATIDQKMTAALRDLGYNQSAISRMTPTQAHQILQSPP